MKLLYLAFVRLPTEKAHGVQIMKTCEALAHEGVTVELVIPGRETAIKEDPFVYYDVQRNFVLTALNTPDWVRWGTVGFRLSALFFSEAAKWQKNFWNADIVYSRDAFVLLQYVLLDRKLVYEAHTAPTFVSTLVAKQAYKLIVISEGLRDAYVTRGVDPAKIVVAHDAVDPTPFQKKFNQEEERDWLGIPRGKKVALYVGKIDAAKGADTFAAASEHVSTNILCVLVGSGPDKLRLQEQFPKALFVPETPYRELPRVLASADVLVLPNSARDDNAAIFTSPLKAFAYLASGKPILASDVPALRVVVPQAHFFKADDSRALATALAQTASSPHPSAVTFMTWNARAKIIHSGFEKYVPS